MVCEIWASGTTLTHSGILDELLHVSVYEPAGFSTYKAKNIMFQVHLDCRWSSAMSRYYPSQMGAYSVPYVQWEGVTYLPEHSVHATWWKRATLLFTCLPAMLHSGLIRGVDRSCNLKRGHCSSEQKQLKENERQPPRVKNRKWATCMLESTTPLACTVSHPPSQTYWACIVMYDQICHFFL